METVLLAGGTGLVGSRITELLKDRYEVRILTRTPKPKNGNITYWKWDFESMTIQDGAIKVDHIINLNGAGIADKRWTTKQKEILIESRVKSNQILATALKESGHKVKSYTCASAIGYYGNRDNEVLDETSQIGQGFLSECCDLWEKSADLAKSYTHRLTKIRIGIVLSSKDGALPKILMTKDLGVLSYFGNGSQYYSWIHIDDLCKIFIKSIENEDYSGVINGVAPTPLTNKVFIKEIKLGLYSKALILPAPAIGLRIAMGEMADVVLNSNRVIPKELNSLNFTWAHPELGPAVKNIIDRGI